MSDPYSALVRDLFTRTPGAGVLDAGPGIYRAHAGGPQHGAEITLCLRVSEGVIHEARYEVLACPHTIAACALLCERLEGQSVAIAQADVWNLADALELPAPKLGCLLLLEDALKAAQVAALADVGQAPGRDADGPG